MSTPHNVNTYVTYKVYAYISTYVSRTHTSTLHLSEHLFCSIYIYMYYHIIV